MYHLLKVERNLLPIDGTCVPVVILFAASGVSTSTTEDILKARQSDQVVLLTGVGS